MPCCFVTSADRFPVCKDYSKVLSYLESQIADGVRVVLAIDD